MNKHKNNISKLKFVQMGENSEEREDLEDNIPDINSSYFSKSDSFEEDLATSSHNITSSKTSLDSAGTKSIPSPSYKKFKDDFSENNLEYRENNLEYRENNNTKSSSLAKLPSFLQKKTQPTENYPQSKFLSTNEEVKALPEPKKSADANVNSFTSIFNKDNEQAHGFKRVFRKSISFLVIHLGLFFAISLAGLNLFNLNFVITLLIIVTYIAFTNIFYVIVADRSYVYLSSIGQVMLTIFVNAFYGLGFEIVTILFTILIVLFSYLAYFELEKIQLSSRLFSISHITTEATRILILSVILIISLGVYNGIISESSSKFLDRSIFSNQFLARNFIIGENPKLALNGYLMDGGFYLESEQETQKVMYVDPATLKSKQATFRDFLSENYESPSVLTEKEEENIRINCPQAYESAECTTLVNQKKDELLLEWKNRAYSDLVKSGVNLELDDLLFLENFSLVTRQYYINTINNFENTDADAADGIIPEFLLIVPLKHVIPAAIATLVYIILFLAKFILNWLAFVCCWIVWNVLKLIGFVKIDIETVEAEIVSI